MNLKKLGILDSLHNARRNITLANNESVNVLVNEMKTEIKRLKEENISVLSRLSYLEGVAEASIGNSG